MKKSTGERYKRRLAKGDTAENRVVRACMRKRRPEWLIEAKRTNKGSKLDRMGVDVVVETTDTGRLRLQVKSSQFFAEQFIANAKPNTEPIGIVIVDPKDDDNSLYGKVLGALIMLRMRQLGEI